MPVSKTDMVCWVCIWLLLYNINYFNWTLLAYSATDLNTVIDDTLEMPFLKRLGYI